VSEDVTKNIDGGRTFEERVFARFDAMDTRFNGFDARFDGVDARFDGVDARFDGVDARFDGVDSAIRDLDSRAERLEIRSYDTKPIWEQALKEIIETRREIAETKRETVQTRRELSKRLDRIEAVVYETRSNLGDAEDRLEKLESKPV
jgi:chromosome segregation ATPase